VVFNGEIGNDTLNINNKNKLKLAQKIGQTKPEERILEMIFFFFFLEDCLA